jgi:hypothetical protein
VSPTFSDPGSSSTWRTYRWAVWAVVSILLVVMLLAITTTLAEGPRLRTLSVDEASAIRSPGATVSLRSDRALAPLEASSVRVTPETPFRLENTDLDVRIVFDYPLLASTTYRISVEGVAPRGLGSSSTWEARFTTPPEDFVFLRAAGGDDELMLYSLDGTNPQVLYRAPGIIGFTRVGTVYAVLRSVQGETFIELVEPTSGAVDRIPDTPGITLVSLSRSAWGTSLVLTVDANIPGQPAALRSLALLDTLGQRTPEIVTGADGRPLGVLKVAVSEVSGNVLVWLRDQTLIRFDPLTGIVVPLGVATELWGFDAIGESAVYVDAMGTVSKHLGTGEETRVLAGGLEGFPVVHEFTVMAPNGVTYQRVIVPGVADGPPFGVVTVDPGSGAHTRIVGSLQSPQTVGTLGLSPNGHYLIVELNDASSTTGFVGLDQVTQRQETRLVIVDLAAGVVFAEEPGYAFTW